MENEPSDACILGYLVWSSWIRSCDTIWRAKAKDLAQLPPADREESIKNAKLACKERQLSISASTYIAGASKEHRYSSAHNQHTHTHTHTIKLNLKLNTYTHTHTHTHSQQN